MPLGGAGSDNRSLGGAGVTWLRVAPLSWVEMALAGHLAWPGSRDTLGQGGLRPKWAKGRFWSKKVEKIKVLRMSWPIVGASMSEREVSLGLVLHVRRTFPVSRLSLVCCYGQSGGKKKRQFFGEVFAEGSPRSVTPRF